MREWGLILIEVALALFGAWAVVSAIACLPIMDEHILLTQSEEEREELRTSFQSLHGSLPQWAPTLADTELLNLCETGTTIAEAEPGGEVTQPAPNVRTCQQLRRAAQHARDELADVWRERSQRASSELTSSIRVAHQAALLGLAVPQTRDDYSAHLAEVHGLHMDYGLGVIAWLDACRTALSEGEARVKRDLNEALDDGSVTPEEVTAFRNGGAASLSCATEMPPRVEYPENRRSELRLGNVTALTLKLHTTRSKDLVLLFGMLGCGLLGAGVTSLARRRRADDHAAGFRPATFSELLSVIVSGFTAAIIVFLAVRSALPMLADGAEVKPYGLLLLCLLGAAFSDVTWRWARDYLGTRFPIDIADPDAQRIEPVKPIPNGRAEPSAADPEAATKAAAPAGAVPPVPSPAAPQRLPDGDGETAEAESGRGVGKPRPRTGKSLPSGAGAEGVIGGSADEPQGD